MTVTDIKDYAKGKFEVYINDEFAFVLYKSELNKYGIKSGAELSDDVISAITDEVLLKRAKKRAMNLLLKGDMTQKKLTQKLKDNKYPDEAIEAAVEYVKSYGYIDDARYAESFIRERADLDSKSIIRKKLTERGIDRHIIDEAINAYYDDDLNADAEEELIKKLIRKKCSDVSLLDYGQRQKLAASLMRKGFSYSMVEKALRD